MKKLVQKITAEWSMKKRIGVVVFFVLLVIVGIVGIRTYGAAQRRKAMSAKRGQVETVQIKKQNLIESISVTGTIASADAWDVSASAKNVKVLEVNYDVGDYVNEGDVIVVLDSSELQTSLSQAQNSQALSSYKENKSIETATESYTEAIEDGNDAYNKAVKSEAEAKEALQEAEADLSEAASALKRQEERLTEANNAYNADPSNNELKAQAEAAQKEYTTRHQAYEVAAEAEEKALEAYETAAENLADAQTANDRSISKAADQLEQAQMEHTYSNDSSQKTIENYQDQIDSCTVVAPISGVITAMNVSVGDTYMGEGNTMFSIADNEHFIVQASVDEYEISAISKDMTAAVIVEALGEEELPAKVSFVAPTASSSNTGSASYKIEIALDDVNTDLRIGMTAKASVVKDAVYDVLTVPYDCVQTDEEGNSVIYIDKDGVRTEVPVTVGMESDYYVEISGDGLEENTRVYYSEPMANNDSQEEADATEMMQIGMPGGGMPAGGGGNRGGGAPGAPGGF